MVMKILQRAMRCGKTYESIKLSAEKKIPIICANKSEISNIMSMAEKIGVSIPDPILAESAKVRFERKQDKRMIVDNVDWVLRLFLGGDVVAGTVDGSNSYSNWSE
jgi:hypothetical protein